MRASGRILSLLACAATVTAGAQTAAAQAAVTPDKQRQTACQRLKANNRDLSPDRRLVLVTRGGSEYGNIYACVLPRGKLRRIARWDDGLGRESYEVVGTAGTWVLVTYGWSDQYGGRSSSLARIDVRSGRSVTLAAYGCNVQFEACASGTSFGTFAIAPSGAGAIELTDLSSQAGALHAFDAAGRLTRLDDAPVQVLRVSSTQIIWTRGGVERHADLPR